MELFYPRAAIPVGRLAGGRAFCCQSQGNVLYLRDTKKAEDGVVMLAILGLGPLEIIIIVVVVVVLFLPALLPKIARRFGETFRMVKDMAESKIDDEDDDTDRGEEEDDKT
jgi:hypothetical protein